MSSDFGNLAPDVFIGAAEHALGRPFNGLAAPLASYINRVYELETVDGERVIAKFYRPGRWQHAALADEHNFVLDCAAEDIPVVAPMRLKAFDSTIGECDGIYFALYPKKSGREIEINTAEQWRRLGAMVGRIHLAGSRRAAPARFRLDPLNLTKTEIDYLLDGDFVFSSYYRTFSDICDELLRVITPLFDGVENIRIHADLHRANIMERPEEGLLIIDFDDMMTGPPVQDLWLLLPGYAKDTKFEFDCMLDGYEVMRDFDYGSIKLIEPLRAMRMIYFLSWCARQSLDESFHLHYPDWGTAAFWRTEINDLERQLSMVNNNLQFGLDH